MILFGPDEFTREIASNDDSGNNSFVLFTTTACLKEKIIIITVVFSKIADACHQHTNTQVSSA